MEVTPAFLPSDGKNRMGPGAVHMPAAGPLHAHRDRGPLPPQSPSGRVSSKQRPECLENIGVTAVLSNKPLVIDICLKEGWGGGVRGNGDPLLEALGLLCPGIQLWPKLAYLTLQYHYRPLGGGDRPWSYLRMSLGALSPNRLVCQSVPASCP